MAKLRIYRSSAGSGKTHTLVSTYLHWALDHSEAFSRILAVTFTNQATQELKQRILCCLHELAQGVPSSISATLQQRKGWDKMMLQSRAQQVLGHVLHRYARFSVSTVDSFFQQVVRGFAQELGLRSGFQIELDTGYVLGKLIDDLVQSASSSSSLRRWLVAFAQNKLLSGQHWNFRRELTALGNELFSESFAIHEAQLIPLTRDRSGMRRLLQRLDQRISHFQSQLQALGQQAMAAMEQAGLSVSDFAYGTRGAVGYLSGLASRRSWKPTQRALKALEHLEAWYTQSSEQKVRIAEVVRKSLQACLQAAVQFYDTHHRVYHTAVAVKYFAHSLGLVTQLLEKLQEYREAHHVMLVSDASSLLRKLIAENDTPFIYEKLGAFYQHFLIDEFQDISGFQWNNLRPLIEQALHEGNESMVVGDAKQSIYRWRGSDWQLLSHQLEQDVSQTKVLNLGQNWRSKQHIVDFNGAFFAAAAAHVASYLSASFGSLTDKTLQQHLKIQIQRLGTAYQDVLQQLPPERVQPDKGYVNITFLKATEEGKTWREVAQARIPLLVESLQREGFALKDIALLVRNHAEGRALSQTLMARQQSSQAQPGCRYDVVSAESLYLGHNLWVNILINALRCLIDENNALAQAELRYLYQVYGLQDLPSAACFQPEKEHAVLPKAFTTQRLYLLQLPLYELVEALIVIFQLNRSSAIPFLQAFQDVLLHFVAKEKTSIQGFLTWWEERGYRHTLPRAQEQDAMTLMTIHQAKGLQFKVVVVPFCVWDLDHHPRRPPTLWCATAVPPFASFPVLPVRYSDHLRDTVYAQAYYEEQMQAYLDHLNLLYVAFTRPKDRLYVLAERPQKVALKTTADLLYQTIRQGGQDDVAGSHTKAWASHWNEAAGVLEIGLPVAPAPDQDPSSLADLQQLVDNELEQVPKEQWSSWESVVQWANPD